MFWNVVVAHKVSRGWFVWFVVRALPFPERSGGAHTGGAVGFDG
jgi:hypothetical protein